MTTLRQIFKIVNFRPTDMLYTSKDFLDHTDYRFENFFLFFWKKKDDFGPFL